MATRSFPDELIHMLRTAQHVVVFTGAGISAESGIPTFRDALTGLWERFDVEALATPQAYERDKALVWGWYEWRRARVMQAQPNPGHLAIAALEQVVPELTVVTQNVDDLHERSGSRDVIHLHGSMLAARCGDCGHPYSMPEGIPDEPEYGRRLQPPRCAACGGDVRPGVVWFGEEMPRTPLQTAFAAARQCDLLISVGTSGIVYPAAQMPQRAADAGAQVVAINLNVADMPPGAHWQLVGASGEILPAMVAAAFGASLGIQGHRKP